MCAAWPREAVTERKGPRRLVTSWLSFCHSTMHRAVTLVSQAPCPARREGARGGSWRPMAAASRHGPVSRVHDAVRCVVASGCTVPAAEKKTLAIYSSRVAASGLVRLVRLVRLACCPVRPRAQPVRSAGRSSRTGPVCVCASAMLTRRRSRRARRLPGRTPVITWHVTVLSTLRWPRFLGISDRTNDRPGIVVFTLNLQDRSPSFSLPLKSVQLRRIPGLRPQPRGHLARLHLPRPLPAVSRCSWPDLQTLSLPPLRLTPTSALDLGIPRGALGFYP